MKILVAFRSIPDAPGWSTGEVLALELEALGHRVMRHATVYGAGWSHQADGPADAVIYCEANDGESQYHALAARECPKVWWVFDDEMYPERAEVFAREMRFDAIASANHKRYHRWRDIHHGPVAHVPYGITREAQAAYGEPKIIDVLMIGSLFPQRVALIQRLRDLGVHVETRSGLPHAEYLRTMASARIALHCYSSGGSGLHVARIYDALGCGTQLVAEAQEGLDDLGAWTFRTSDECAALCRERLPDAERRGAEARASALRQHTMAHRAQALVELIGRVNRERASMDIKTAASNASIQALQYGADEPHRRPRISLIHASARNAAPENPPRDAWLKAASGAAEIEYILSTDAPEAGGAIPHVWGPNRGSVDAWNRAAALATGDVLIQMSDDMVPEDGWDASILEAIGDTTKPCVLWVRDGLQARCVTLAIMTKARYRQQGCLLWPEYVSMWSDNDLTAWAQHDGVLKRAEWIEVTHKWGGAQGDAVYARQNSSEAHALGLEVFERRKKGWR